MTESERKYLHLVQWVRILDVVFIGPAMIYSGILVKNKRLKYIMIFLGLMTIIFNAYNWYLYNKYAIVEKASGGTLTLEESKQVVLKAA